LGQIPKINIQLEELEIVTGMNQTYLTGF